MYTNCSRFPFVPIFERFILRVGVSKNLFKSSNRQQLHNRIVGGLCSLIMITSTSTCYSSSFQSSTSSSSSRRTFDACPEIACSESKSATSGTFDEDSTRKRKRMSANTTSAKTTTTATYTTTDEIALSDIENEDACPDNRELLGLHTWHFLHSVAAYYPLKATNEEKLAAVGLLFGVAQLYPCSHCRAAFAADMEANPPKLDSRDEFSIWLCERHNSVNQSLGKPIYPCVASILNERWRSGSKKCLQKGQEGIKDRSGD
jgi:FAD-linked sulfhydryl oxidase